MLTNSKRVETLLTAILNQLTDMTIVMFANDEKMCKSILDQAIEFKKIVNKSNEEETVLRDSGKTAT